MAAVEVLEERGPGLGRPFVDTIASSRHSNMRELRPLAGNLRILFAFDKTDRWDDWYREMIPVADVLFDSHLDEIAEEEAP